MYHQDWGRFVLGRPVDMPVKLINHISLVCRLQHVGRPEDIKTSVTPASSDSSWIDKYDLYNISQVIALGRVSTNYYMR